MWWCKTEALLKKIMNLKQRFRVISDTPCTSRLQNLVEVRFVASALGPQFCLHYNSGLVWLKKTWLAGRIAPFALLVVELCPVA